MPIEAAPRILLFGHPGSGKSSLLGALFQAGETQGERLGAEVIDPSGRLPRIRDHLYSQAEFHNTHTELVTYELRLRPWRIGTQPVGEPLAVIVSDCDGNAANALLKHPDPITERRVRGTIASAVIEANLIALVVNAAADDGELHEAFEEFLMFLERVHGRKAFDREVGGFPIFLVLTQCDSLARANDTREIWEAKVGKRLHHALRGFEEFLNDQHPISGAESPYLPFGSVEVRGYAVAVREPQFSKEPSRLPYGVAELFHDLFAAANRHGESVAASRRRLRQTLWAVAVAIWMLFAGALTVSLYQPKPADVGLAERVRGYWDREPPAAVRLASANLDRNRRRLDAFQADPGFFALPPDLRDFVEGRLMEIEAYQNYRAKLRAAHVPTEARSLEELARIEVDLNGPLALPPGYTWGETEAAQLRDKWLADIPLLRSAESAWHQWYSGLINRALALTHASSFAGDWRNRVAALHAEASRPPHAAEAPIPGSKAVPHQRGEAATFGIAAEFDRVYQAQRDWEFTRSRLDQLRGLADAVGLTSDASHRILVIAPPEPGLDHRGFANERFKAITAQFGERPWRLADFPEPGRGLLTERIHESYSNGVRQARQVIGAKASGGDSPQTWRTLADSLGDPAIRDWGRILQFLAQLENPQAPNPVEELERFLTKKAFAIDLKGLDLAIPLALRVPAVIPSGSLTITISAATDSSIAPKPAVAAALPKVKAFKVLGEPTQKGLLTIYHFVPERSGAISYHPGETLKVECPVRSGDHRFTLTWNEGTNRTFPFDRLSREPKLVGAKGSEPGTGVTLSPIPGAAIPALPDLLPELPPIRMP